MTSGASNLRVTFVTTNINLVDGGGSNFSFHLAASELARIGHNVSVISLNPAPPSLPVDLPYRVIDLGWTGKRRLTQMRITRDAMHRYAGMTDIYHVYDCQLALGAGAYRATGGTTPVVVNLNKYLLFCTNQNAMDGHCHQHCGVTKRLLHARGSAPSRIKSVPLRLYEKQVGFDYVNHVDHFLATSPAAAQIYAQAGFDTQRCTIVPPLIDYKRIRAQLANPDQPCLPQPEADETWQVLFAARLVPAKGADILLDALALLHEPTHLHIAGDGPHRNALERRARELGLSDRVTFHGWVPNEQLWSLYQQMHLFVHPGRWPEPGGRTILEAMTIGVPIIVSDLGGPPWLLGDVGLTFEPGSSRDLAAKMATVFGEYRQFQDRVSRGRQRAKSFDRRHLAGSLQQAYHQVLAGL
jgi:glycosyltransferase involved in cell wall biosynthesis